MNMNATTLRKSIEAAQRELGHLKHQLALVESTCTHLWQTVQDDLVSGGYQFEGDGAGVDRRPPMWIHETRTPRWRRTCDYCGKVEYTQDVTISTQATPKFP